MLYRIDRIHYEHVADKWEDEAHPYYQYVCGLRNVGKACLDAEKDRIISIERLNFSFRGLIVCLKKTRSSEYNQTKKKFVLTI